ncbi:hypothetical protein EDD29_0002 [Actinocorallia herbida]|uniref:Uncharacterized protein n=1 Tax=Actinocorallia herbida TaxID=58109 RepID=A0A3N1CMJ3_9ACTN|nr:hypothetical protein [Actinocorallia herbida]ROO82522.1 hypothetical protein EDD29_0002 [Actinocorallia herbida]
MSATELGPWAVVVPGGETGYAYGRFVEREIADRFAAFVAAKFDTTAVVVPDTEVSADAVRLDAARELLNWWDTQPAATVAPAVNGCGWCGYAQTGHGIRYSAIPGLHAWTAPTDRQRPQPDERPPRRPHHPHNAKRPGDCARQAPAPLKKGSRT